MSEIDDIPYDSKLDKLKWELKNELLGWLFAILIGENIIIAILLLEATLTHS